MGKKGCHCYERAEREFRRDTPPGVSDRTAQHSGHLGRGVPTRVSFVDRGGITHDNCEEGVALRGDNSLKMQYFDNLKGAAAKCGSSSGVPYCSASIAAWSFLLMPFRMGMAKTRVSTSANAWTEPTPQASKIQARGYRMGRKQLP